MTSRTSIGFLCFSYMKRKYWYHNAVHTNNDYNARRYHLEPLTATYSTSTNSSNSTYIRNHSKISNQTTYLTRTHLLACPQRSTFNVSPTRGSTFSFIFCTSAPRASFPVFPNWRSAETPATCLTPWSVEASRPAYAFILPLSPKAPDALPVTPTTPSAASRALVEARKLACVSTLALSPTGNPACPATRP